MIIKKFQGKSEEEATNAAKKELGARAVVMNVKEIKPKGFLRAFKSSTYEVTAALEEEPRMSATKPVSPSRPTMDSINMVADEPIEIPTPERGSRYDRASAGMGGSGMSGVGANRMAGSGMGGTGTGMNGMGSGAGMSGMGSGMGMNGMGSGASMSGMGSGAGMSGMGAGRMDGSGMDGSGMGMGRYDRTDPHAADVSGLEEKLEALQNILENKLTQPTEPDTSHSGDASREDSAKVAQARDEGLVFLKMLYNILLKNDVDERYVNQIMDESEKVMRNGSNVDFILSNIYQKMILKLGQTRTIELSEKGPKVVFFIGPTGVGKTTTIAKIASRFKVEHGKKVALLTADTYRIAAAEQLRTYANIMDTPLTIVYSLEEMGEALERLSEYDLVLVDTAGFSHRNQEQKDEIKKLVDSVGEEYEKEVYLVLSASTKYRDLMEIADSYHELFDFRMIFTKMDETSCYGNIFNMKMYTGAPLSYATFGQNVPDDIEVFDTQKMVKLLLGGK